MIPDKEVRKLAAIMHADVKGYSRLMGEDAIYGDEDNIAARIEALTEPGGVSISRTVYDHVRNKLKFGNEHQGEHQVKNIAEPVRVYKVLTAPEHADPRMVVAITGTYMAFMGCAGRWGASPHI